MNEIHNFGDGSINGCDENNPWDNPPYVPGGDSLYKQTICLSAKHFAGLHYNLHNVYGLKQCMETFKYEKWTFINRNCFITERLSESLIADVCRNFGQINEISSCRDRHSSVAALTLHIRQDIIIRVGQT